MRGTRPYGDIGSKPDAEVQCRYGDQRLYIRPEDVHNAPAMHACPSAPVDVIYPVVNTNRIILAETSAA